MSKKEVECFHCGRRMLEHKQGLATGLVRSLYMVAEVQRDTGKPVFLRETRLVHEQKANFNKLKYWGLVKMGRTDMVKGGDWLVTDKGFQFLRGELSVVKFVVTYDNRVLRTEGDNIFISDITDGWKYRPAWGRDAEPHDPTQPPLL